MKSMIAILVFVANFHAYATETQSSHRHTDVKISSAAHAKHGHDGVNADTALRWLKNGNKRFTSGHFRNDGRTKKDVHRLAKGQAPHAIVLSCADSRVPPEHIFDQGLGEIFTIRVAGEALDNSVIASVEYAVEHLGTKLIVVLGHTHCGAVKAALTTKNGESAGSPALDALVGDIKPRLPASSPEGPVATESASNAKGVGADLVKRSKIINNKVQAGELKIVPALYRLDGGDVDWL